MQVRMEHGEPNFFADNLLERCSAKQAQLAEFCIEGNVDCFASVHTCQDPIWSTRRLNGDGNENGAKLRRLIQSLIVSFLRLSILMFDEERGEEGRECPGVTFVLLSILVIENKI